MRNKSEQVGLERLRERAFYHAWFSLLIPGLGQFAQRRFRAASIHLGTVTAYVACTIALGNHRALLGALVWNLWSVLDAYRHRSD